MSSSGIYNTVQKPSLLTMTQLTPLASTLVGVAFGSVLKDGAGKFLPSPSTNSASKKLSATSKKKTTVTKKKKSESETRLARVYESWFNVSRPVRFFVSGNFGNVAFFLIERCLYQILTSQQNLPTLIEEYKETVSFFWGYTLQIVVQHMLHAFWGYGMDTISTREKYLRTLVSQFYAYGFALVGSTTLNLFLIRSGLDKTVSFFATMMIFACINYFLVGFLVQRSVATADAKSTKGGRSRPTRVAPPKTFNTPRSTTSRTNRTSSSSSSRTLVNKTPRGGAAFGLDYTVSSTDEFLKAVQDTPACVDTRRIQHEALLGIHGLYPTNYC